MHSIGSPGRTTAGNGSYNTNATQAGVANPGSSGGGGGAVGYTGGGTQNGSSGRQFWPIIVAYVGNSAGQSGPGANGPAVAAANYGAWSVRTFPGLWGSAGIGGSSGALGVAGGSNKAGAGGAGGYPTPPIQIRCGVLDDQSGGVIHNDGEVGSNATADAVASNANNDTVGGGGGGGGGSGGPVVIGYARRTAAGTIRASGGAGGTGGVGKRRFDDDTALTAWATGTAYTARNIRRPTVANGYGYTVCVAGTSHATTEPTWPTTPGATVVDGTVTWCCVEEGSNKDDVSGSGGNGATGSDGPVILEQLIA
jgi:hypothetical protein